MESFKGKVAIVTGGGSGIGKATAWGLAQKGAHIVVAEVNPEHLEKISEEIERGK